MGSYCVLRAVNNGIGIDSDTVSRIKKSLELPSAAQSREADFYHAYFRSCALRESHDTGLAPALNRMQRALAERRRESGRNKGSWDPEDKWGPAGGRVYSTSLASLSLEAGANSNNL